MKYAQWTIKRPEGSTPEPLIRSRGGQASGGFMKDADTVIGYVWNDVDLTGLEKWNFSTMTNLEAMAIAQAMNAECFFGDDGTIQAPQPELQYRLNFVPKQHAPRTRVSTYVSDWISRVNTIDYLVVAGGGSGGAYYYAGGGGAGGVLESTLRIVSGTSYTITIGAGGSATGTIGTQNSGNDSVFGSITATGGGGGGSWNTANNANGVNGGSGGGSGSISTSNTAGTGVSGQGFAGGTSSTGASAGAGGGGGGGSAVGSNGSGTTAGNGGAGYTTSISGSSVVYGAGGGGSSYGGSAGSGGAGGGGAGGTISVAPTAGTANRGGGGGGASHPPSNTSGAGGSGVVILSYQNNMTLTIGSGLTYSSASVGTRTVVTFTAGTGSVTFSFADTTTRQSVAGYVAGGRIVLPSYLNRIDKFSFPADTKTTLSATLTQVIQFSAGMANSGVAGYSAGGNDPSVNVIDKISFPADTKSTLSATTSTIIYSAAGFANSGVAGYFAGGHNDASGSSVDRIDKITFPADTKTTLSAVLTTIVRQPAGFSNTGVAGYVAGGSQYPTYYNRVDKITFPADTKSTLSATLTASVDFLCGFADYGVAGYVAGGYDGATTNPLTRIDKISFPADTKSTLSAVLSTPRNYSPAGFANTGVAGYVAGGHDGATPYVSSVDKIAFPADTRTTLTATLTAATGDINCGFADCGVF